MMSFPARPANPDEAPARFLPLFEAPQWPRLYVLGCFARYVTIYAQQVRALNLIHCMALSGVLSGRTRLALVGGGIAGVTAAAAAIRMGISGVAIFEQDEDILALQQTSEQRYVHPHIYDWPLAGGVDDREAGLPILTWQAGRAADVRNRIKGGWDQIVKDAGLSWQAIRRGKATQIEQDQAGLLVNREAFDAVILAVGFGHDAVLGTDTDGYWTDSRINSREVNSEEGDWLVSGTGDGALTDLMRLCIRGFRHEQVLGAIDDDVRVRVGEELLGAERNGLGADDLERIYLKAAGQVGEYLDNKELLKQRTIPGTVWLNAKRKDIFSPRASVLNRLITAYLLSRERFKLIDPPRKIKVNADWRPGGLVDLRTKGGSKPFLVRHSVLRHGPRRETTLAASFPQIYRECTDLISAWRTVRQHDDWTKEPLYRSHEFAPKQMPPLRVDFGDRLGCLTVGPQQGSAAAEFKDLARDSLERCQRVREWKLDLGIVHLAVDEVYGSQHSYERAVRALCHSPFALFDLTHHDPGVMILLGIRAAVRRGVTLTVTADPTLRPIFNLSGTNPIHLGERNVDRIKEAMLAATDALREQSSSYLDLPVFDALRRVGSQSRTIPFREKILLLGWFDKQYRNRVKDKIEQEFLVHESLKGTTPDIVTTLDTSSPQLVEQRLYALIRFTELCIADWTGWRPNVFFELGVRLAVAGTDPISILCDLGAADSSTASATGTEIQVRPEFANRLVEFFGATRFQLDHVDPLRQRFRHFIERREVHCPSLLMPRLPAARTYEVVMEAIDHKGEPGGLPIDQHMEEYARSLVRAFVAEGGDIVPLLFADVLAPQAKERALESLLAIWFYLEGRHQLVGKKRRGGLNDEETALWKQMEQLWNKIDFLSGEVQSQKLKSVRKRLETAMRSRSK